MLVASVNLPLSGSSFSFMRNPARATHVIVQTPFCRNLLVLVAPEASLPQNGVESLETNLGSYLSGQWIVQMIPVLKLATSRPDLSSK